MPPPRGRVLADRDEEVHRTHIVSVTLDNRGEPRIEHERYGLDAGHHGHMLSHVEVAVQDHAHHRGPLAAQPEMKHLGAVV